MSSVKLPTQQSPQHRIQVFCFWDDGPRNRRADHAQAVRRPVSGFPFVYLLSVVHVWRRGGSCWAGAAGCPPTFGDQETKTNGWKTRVEKAHGIACSQMRRLDATYVRVLRHVAKLPLM